MKNLSLADAINKALNNNKLLQLSRLDENIALAHYQQTEAIFLPQVSFSYTAISTNNPLNAFGFELEQQSITASDFNPALLNHPSATPDFTTKLALQQPLVNMDMIYLRKAAQSQMAVYQYKTQRTKEYLIFEVQKGYLQLALAYQEVEVLQNELQTTKALYSFTNDHFKQGLIQQSDVLNVQVRVATVESNLVKAKSNIQNASDYLSVLMGMPLGASYTSPSTIDMEDVNMDTIITISPLRSDFAAMQKAIEVKNLMIAAGKMSYLPKLNAFGSYQYNDSRMLGFGANAYLAGIQLSWDIFNGNKTKNNIASQTLERKELTLQLTQQKEQNNLELSKTKRAITDAQWEIAQHRSSIEQATESLRIVENRYTQGLVIPLR